MKHLFIILILFIAYNNSFSQSYKYQLQNADVTAKQSGTGYYELIIDSNLGQHTYYFTYKEKDGEMYVYELYQVNNQKLTDFQKKSSYLKCRTKFSDLCKGIGDRALISVIGKSEVIDLSKQE